MNITELDSNILFLDGCFLQEIEDIEDIFKKKLIDKASRTKIIIYDNLVSVFKNWKEWPTSNNLKCWHCTNDFDTIPLFIPTLINPSEHPDNVLGNMQTLGNFCSFPCAYSYIIEYIFQSSKWELINNLKILYESIYRKKIDNFPKIPPHTVQCQYGGKTTPLEFRKLFI